MKSRWLPACLCLLVVAVAAWVGNAGQDRGKPGAWAEVLPGLLRTPGYPAGYALVDGPAALLIDAPADPEGLRGRGVERVELALLTHHHRDTCAAAGRLLAAQVPVRAPKASREWLGPDEVRKFWQGAIPLPNSRVSGYLVVPVGLEGIDCSLEDGQAIDWHGWNVRVVATPGHSKDHVAFALRKGRDGPLVVCCGDALASSGKLWTPYTTDWDHWTDVGLKPAAESLRKLAALKPDVLLPAHGAPVTRDAAAALERAADAVQEVGFLKSFERFTKQRLGNAPEYRFLAKEQAQSNGSLPWSRVSEHLFLTGNTYVLTSKEDRAFLVIDPWGQRSADQVAKLKAEQGLGALEVVVFSHAHFDHYDGVHNLPGRETFQVWSLDLVAAPVADPYLLRAPFLDPRPVRFDRRFRAGETAAWREYRFRFHHLPGQSEFTMGVEAEIDGKRCYFTADNFFHQDMFSGSGGWMGMNRSWPPSYAASARKVLTAAPEWVLAEHGGPFEFNAEDFRRRVQWGQAGAAAADAVCVSGHHCYDWDPNRVHVRPLLRTAKAGETVRYSLLVHNPLPRREKVTVRLEGRGLTPDQAWDLDVAGGATGTQELALRLDDRAPAGRHIFALRVAGAGGPDGSDGILAVDVGP